MASVEDFKNLKKPGSLEGLHAKPESNEDLLKVIAKAVDYRGDVTVILKDGSTKEGFLYNYDKFTDLVSIYIRTAKRESHQDSFKYDTIQEIIFSGEDEAFGKSWDDWMTKGDKERAKAAEKAKELSEQLGHL
jgi:small nuclear ribonucleoprotein (snRNP)-like protein